MNCNKTFNRSCPASISINITRAANRKIVTGENKIAANHAGSIKTSKQIYPPFSNIISSRRSVLRGTKIGIGDGPPQDAVRSHLPKRACDAAKKGPQLPRRDTFDGYGCASPPRNYFNPKAFAVAEKSQKRSTRGPEPRGRSSPAKQPGAVAMQRTPAALSAFPPPNQCPLPSDLPSATTPNISSEDAFRPTADDHYHGQHQGLRHVSNQYQNCSALDLVIIDFQVRTYTNNARDSCASDLNYQVGQALRHRAHALPFSSSFQARAVLTRLPVGTPLFANRGRGWTYGRLLGRFEDDAGDVCAIVASDGRGDVEDICNEIFKEKDWKTCFMLVNWNATVPGRPSKSVSFQWDTKVPRPSRPPPPFMLVNWNAIRNNDAGDRRGIAPLLEGADAASPSLVSTVRGRSFKSVSFHCDAKVHPPSRPPPPSRSVFSGSNSGARGTANVGRLPSIRGPANDGAAGIRRH